MYVSKKPLVCLYICAKPQGEQKGVSDQLTANYMSLWALINPKPS